MAPAKVIHAGLQNELGRLVGNHLRASGGSCRMFANPGVVPATMSAHNMRVPDLAVSCSPHDLSQTALTEPVVIVDILSASNRAETWANVWAYTSIASVQEILVLHSEKVGGDLLRRLADGTWPDRAMPVEGELALDSIGFRMSLTELYSWTPLLRG
jgi:Uma2 family endonuclease